MPELVAVEGLGAIDVGHRQRDQLEQQLAGDDGGFV
jgi:hypothetical protein